MLVKKKKRVNVGFRWPNSNAPRESERWQFQRDGVSPSLINEFLLCREHFRLGTAEGWRSSGYEFSIEFGNIFHWLHAQRCKMKKDRPVAEMLKLYKEVFAKQKIVMTPTDKRDQETGYAMTTAVWPEYCTKYKEDLKRKWTLFEDPVSIEYVYYISGIDFKTRLRGVLDGLYEEEGGLVLHEMKTKSQMNPFAIQTVLHLDVQVMTYATILRKLYPNKKIKGCSYDLIRRPGSNPKKNETLQQYSKRIAGNVKNEPDHYFARPHLDLSNEDIDKWVAAFLDPLLNEMGKWVRGISPHVWSPSALSPRPWGSRLVGLIASGNSEGLVRGTPFDHHNKAE